MFVFATDLLQAIALGSFTAVVILSVRHWYSIKATGDDGATTTTTTNTNNNNNTGCEVYGSDVCKNLEASFDSVVFNFNPTARITETDEGGFVKFPTLHSNTCAVLEMGETACNEGWDEAFEGAGFSRLARSNFLRLSRDSSTATSYDSGCDSSSASTSSSVSSANLDDDAQSGCSLLLRAHRSMSVDSCLSGAWGTSIGSSPSSSRRSTASTASTAPADQATSTHVRLLDETQVAAGQLDRSNDATERDVCCQGKQTPSRKHKTSSTLQSSSQCLSAPKAPRTVSSSPKGSQQEAYVIAFGRRIPVKPNKTVVGGSKQGSSSISSNSSSSSLSISSSGNSSARASSQKPAAHSKPSRAVVVGACKADGGSMSRARSGGRWQQWWWQQCQA